MREWTEEQRAAIETLDRPVTLLAGAGSGKTTVLVERYLRLLARGSRPRELLTVTFTNEAADQMRERIALRLREAGDAELALEVEEATTLGTLHGFCYGILDQYGAEARLAPIQGIRSYFELADRFDRAYRGWLEDLPEEKLAYLLGYFTHYELKGVLRGLFDARFAFRRSLAHLEDAAPEAAMVRELAALAAPLFERLEQELQGRGVYSFDDLEHLTLRIFEEAPDVPARLQAQFRHVLVDEFQDTSQVQWDILRHVLGKSLGKLFVVGDPKQSIYSFRNADYRLFLSVASLLEREHGGETLELTANFRSSPSLVDVVNGIARDLFAGTDIPFHPMRSGRPPGELPVAARIARYQTEERRRDSSRAEIRAIVSRVKRFVSEGNDPAGLAILFRATDKIPALHDALSEAAIPVVATRTSRLFEYYDILDVASYLKVVLNPLDDFSLAAFLRSSFVRFGEERLWKLARTEGPEGTSLYERLVAARPPELAWLFGVIESGAFDVDECLAELFRRTRYFPESGEALLALLEPLSQEKLTVADAVARLETWRREDILIHTEEGSGPAGGVRLMTVHAAKGLEFPHVYLVDNLRPLPRKTPTLRLDPGLAPGIRYRRDGEPVATASYEELAERAVKNDLEESKRILYVALTRARETLTLFLPRDPEAAPKNSWGALLESAVAAMTAE